VVLYFFGLLVLVFVCALVPERGAHRISGLFLRMFKMRLRAGVADDTPPFVCRLGMDVCCCSSFQEDSS